MKFWFLDLPIFLAFWVLYGCTSLKFTEVFYVLILWWWSMRWVEFIAYPFLLHIWAEECLAVFDSWGLHLKFIEVCMFWYFDEDWWWHEFVAHPFFSIIGLKNGFVRDLVFFVVASLDLIWLGLHLDFVSQFFHVKFVAVILGFIAILYSFFVLLEGDFLFCLFIWNCIVFFVYGCIFSYSVLINFFYIFTEKIK